ncbi:helix-turn-helix domain-containing protein [Actinospica sp.]|uniref:helix-turn-helix domain-containing protein n=1 Tax=Actinospica sp. TaxID=1872142 RepID=UPI002C036D94|nr:helix-turn-helix domain-containing protein [Actinospica sp.]HWG25713.1 helix-turn-helix domain-containing protein [Actinospica sp.]
MPVLAHSLETRAKAVTMLRDGVTNAEVARIFGVPSGTIGHWKHEDRRRSGTLPGRLRSRCPRCEPGAVQLDRREYSYLLGLYLGDGCISDGAAMRRKGVYFLNIACADAWPGLMDECEAAMRAVMPHNSVNRVQKPGMHEVKAYSKHWPCLFPQHGPGRKHERAIVLEPWQQAIVDEFPQEFVRGLIHSDGCRVYNVAVRTRNGKTTRCYYSRYHFTNESSHIRDLFTGTLDKLGVEWRYNRRNCVSIARRESVRRLDEFVGPKH